MSARGAKRSKTVKPNHIKPDQAILTTALRDISTVRNAPSSEEPLKQLKSAKNLITAYKDFMQKGRLEMGLKRPWEKRPASKVSNCNATAHPRAFCT